MAYLLAKQIYVYLNKVKLDDIKLPDCYFEDICYELKTSNELKIRFYVQIIDDNEIYLSIGGGNFETEISDIKEFIKICKDFDIK